MVLNLFLAFASLLSLTWSASTFSPARPPAIPLAVRSPYLSTWQFAGSDGGNGGYLAGQWPTFWEGQVTGWAGLIRVDGVPYVWMGAPTFGSGTSAALVNQTSFEYTSTKSIFHQNVDNKVGLVVTFLSPITPSDYVRASLVSSYLDVQVYSLDGNTHDVQIYTDISAEWVSGDRSAIAQWDYGVASNSSITPSTTGIGSNYPTASSNMPTTLRSTYSGGTEAVIRTEITFVSTTTLSSAAVTKRNAAATQPVVWVTDVVTQYVTTCPIGHTLITSGSTTVLTAPSAITTAITTQITSTASGTPVASSSGSSSASPASASSVSSSPKSTIVVSSASASSMPVTVTSSGSVSSAGTSSGASTSGSSSGASSASSRASSSSGISSTSSRSSSASASASSSASSSRASSSVSSSGSSSRVSSASSASSGSSSSGASSASSRSSSASTSASSAVQTNGIAYHRVYRQTQLAFSEVDQQTEYGYWYYMTANTTNLSYQSGRDITVRDAFANNGVLPDTKDTNYRAINNDYPVFGFAIDLGSVGAQNKSALWTINLNQENAIQFEGYANRTLPSLWTSYFDTALHANTYFYNDYSSAFSLATTFDNKVVTDSVAAGGSNYSIITQLSVRQAFGALQLVNTPETPYLFLKEISSDGNVQTVDVIFPFHPIAMYTNPDLIKLMLEPLFINQEAGNWPYAFSIHDLGTHYPNATGHNDGNDEMQPLEECGDMIIMSLAYAQRTNDNAWLASHYDILRQWNDYLIQEALIPANQISTDDFAGALANQTNLAIKGIIGIEAMAQIANRTGHGTDGANYTRIAHNYVAQWQNLSMAAGANPPHTTLNYGNNTSYSLLYNIFADKELGLQLVPQSVYDMQSAFYPTVALTYGVPLDTRHTYTKSDWEIFCAAVANEGTKELFIDDLAKWINQTPTNMPFTDLYDAITGNYPAGITFAARPVVGGEFALLALNGAPTSGYVPVAGS